MDKTYWKVRDQSECIDEIIRLTAQLTALEQELADEKKAAGYWMEQSCKDHNRAEKLEQQLATYQGAVEVEVEVEVEGMKVPNWRESSPELKAAWFEFKSKYTGAGTPCLSSFAAGWNMQKQPPTAQLAERDAEIERLKRKAQDAEKNVRKQMLDRAGRGLERYSITAEDGEVHCKPDPDGFYVTMGTVTALVEQLSTSQQEIARLQQQSVGWVAVFDENATLRAEVDRLREQAAFAQKELTDVIHTRNDSHECIRKQAAQEILEWLLNHRPLSYAARPHFGQMVSKFKTEFGLEG